MAPQKTLRRWTYCNWTGTLLVGAVSAALAGCTADPPRDGRPSAGGGEGRGAAAQAAVVAGGWESVTLPWGKGPGEVGFRGAGPEQLAEGPSAVAVAPSGDVLVLDRRNERVMAIDPKGVVTTRVSVPMDAEHLAAGPGGLIAAWSPLRGTVWLSARDGAALGEVTMPRELREIERIEVGISHRIAVVSALQDTLQLGSPRAPLDLGSALRTRREGAAFLADGRGVASRRTESGAGEIVVYRHAKAGDDTKVDVAWTYPVEGPVAAVHVIGASGEAVCVRIERVTQEEALAVEREVRCVEAGTGKVLLQRALGRPGIAPVRDDLAMGGEPPVVAFIRADEGGLRVERSPLDSPSAVAAAKEVGR